MSWKETDVLQLWKNSTVVPMSSEKNKEIMEKTSVGERLAGSRSKLWTSVSELSGEERKVYLRRLISAWPYKLEKLALLGPMYVTNGFSMITSTLISAKINGDIHSCNPKIPFLESLRSCPKFPVLGNAYIAALTHFALYKLLIHTPSATNDERPCTSCVLTRFVGISLLSGVIMPTISAPHISYYSLIRSSSTSAGNHIDLITLSYEYSRSVWRKLPLYIAAHVVVSAVACYAFLWGRDRIFETMDVDSELVQICIKREKEAEKTRLLTRLKNTLGDYGFSKKQIGSPVLKSSEQDKELWKS